MYGHPGNKKGVKVRQPAFDEHPIWASLNSLQASLDKADDRSEPEAAEPLDAVRYLAALIRSHQEPNDTAPYSSASLQAVNSHLPNLINEVNNYVSNGNVGHIQNAEKHADAALNLLGSWPSSLLKGGAAAQANRVFTEYRDDATEAIQALRQANAGLREAAAKQKHESDAALQALKAEINDLSAKIKQDEARLDQALTTTNEAFTAKQSEREEKFRDFVAEQGRQLEGLAGEHLQTLKNLVKDSRNAYNQVDELREGTEKVAGLASADILAGKFEAYSKQQWRWGVGANGLGFVALAIGLYVIAATLSSVGSDESISWQYTTLKLGVTLTIVAASAVAFRLGAIFLSRSSTNKRMELELRAIGPFFADIDDPEAVRDAKRAFVERTFGSPRGEVVADGQISSSDLASLVRELMEIVKTVTTRSSSV